MLEKAQIATVGGNMDTQCNSGGGSKRKEKSWRESLHLLGEYLNNSTDFGRTTDVRDDSVEISDGNEEQAIENRRKMIIVAKWYRTWLNCILLFCGGSNL